MRNCSLLLRNDVRASFRRLKWRPVSTLHSILGFHVKLGKHKDLPGEVDPGPPFSAFSTLARSSRRRGNDVAGQGLALGTTSRSPLSISSKESSVDSLARAQPNISAELQTEVSVRG